MESKTDIFSVWPSLSAMAEAIGDKVDTVRKWKRFRRIPEDAWDRVIDAALKVGQPLTVQQIYDFNAPMRKRGKGAVSIVVKKRRSPKVIDRVAIGR